MNILKIIAMLFVFVAVVSAAGCAEKAQITENETQNISENVTDVESPTTHITLAKNVSVSKPSVTSASKNRTDSTSSTVVDVVCKMKIDKKTAEFTSEYKGKTYYFCALSCKEKFDENPEKYISSEISENNSETTENRTQKYCKTTENKTQKNCKATENKTQEASEQVISATTNDTDSTSSTVVDAVCKMKIDKRTAEFKSNYKGTTYYFCSASCKEKFDENPKKYINSETTENNSTATENNSKTAENNSETKENKTQEASEQITSVATNSVNSASSTVVDVVCKMKIDKKTVEFKSNYKGKMYYFCSASCKEKFDENPGKYT